MKNTMMPTSEVARLAGVSPSTISREVARGNLKPAFQGPGPSGVMLFDPSDIALWLNSRRSGQASA